MRRLLLNFQLYKGWNFHFVDQDCKTSVGSRHFAVDDLTVLRKIVIKLRCEDIADFDHSIRAWARGSVYVHLSDEQCRFFWNPRNVKSQDVWPRLLPKARPA